MGKTKVERELIKPLTLEIDKESWEVFKDLVPRNLKLNEVICALIYKYIADYSEPADPNSQEFKEWLERVHKRKEVEKLRKKC